MSINKNLLCIAVILGMWAPRPLPAVPFDPSVAPLLKKSFLYGRDYFVLRSGRTKMVVQADKVDLGPAFVYLLFDAEDSHLTGRKETAWNWGDGQGMANSALEVILGGYPYTAVGHYTDTRWVAVDGIPAVEAVWWAGGVRVTERIFALVGKDAFLRRIELASVNLAGQEEVRLRLSLPPGQCKARDGMLIQQNDSFRMALAAVGPHASKVVADGGFLEGFLEVGPLRLMPGQRASVDALLLAGVPSLRPRETMLFTGVAPKELPWPLGADLTCALPGAIEQTRQWWARSSSIATDDGLLREIFDHARFALPGMVADNGAMDAGIFEYGVQWVRDSSNTLLGLVHAGQFELARRGFEHILKDMIRDDGRPMTSGVYDDPVREELDQMGELVHALKAYWDWTGDESLVREHRLKLLAIVERPLRPEFRNEAGMVHSRREFWERDFADGYELAYQTYLVLGLRDAAEMAGPLGAGERAARWRAEADRTLTAVLSQPTFALVDGGRLIKRRRIDGRRVNDLRGYVSPGYSADGPADRERGNLIEPDATMALPIAFGLVEPQGALSTKTLDKLEELWNARWIGGGYGRCHGSSEPSNPGPWPFASCFILRAQHEAGLFDRSRRTLEWLHDVQGGRGGAWFEEIPSVRSVELSAGIIPWVNGEISLFVVRHVLGVHFENQRLVIKPALYPNSPPVKADLRFRQRRLQLEISGAGAIVFAEVNGTKAEPDRDGALRLPADFRGGRIVLHAGSGEMAP